LNSGSESESLLAPGSSVDHFEVVRLVGRGGMGEVYLARDTKLGRKVALKLVHPEALGDEQACERFLYEARVTARFNHPHIVTIYAVGDHSGSPYVALEYLEGQNLRERMRDGRSGVKECTRIGLAIAEALAEAHRAGVLHRDLKPENVLLPRDGRLRVVDFGLAKAVTTEDMALAQTLPLGETRAGGESPTRPFETSGSGFAGTPLYMAPEQWHRRECDAGTDIWALGVILYELLSGERPFRGDSMVEICAEVCSPDPSPSLDQVEGVPDTLRTLVTGCLEKEAEKRPGTDEVVDELERLLSGARPSVEREVSPFRGLLPFTERHSEYFFGREGEVLEFLERLREEPVLPVAGPSGAGKSSFVLAGVIPRLREQARWIALTVRPGSRPFQALASRVVRGEGPGSQQGTGSALGSGSGGGPRDPDRERRVAGEILDSPGLLALELQRIADRERSRVLLFVDQLEEIYTQVDDPEARRRFMEAICTAADDPEGPVRVVFTLRDDFLVRLSEVRAARRVLGRSTVLRTPGPEALAEILNRPLERVGYRFDDPALVELMISSVGGESAGLPLLQFACSQLWERRDRTTRTITRDAYDAIGGVEGALARRADAVLDSLTPDQLATAQRIFLRLVTSEGTRRTVSRSDLVGELGAGADEVIDRLIAERTLVARKGGPDRGPGVELVHESLIRNWDRLRRWIDESREDLAFLAEVEQAAELWRRRGRRAEEVWQGDALHGALRKAERLPSLPTIVDQFLGAGRSRERRRRLRKRIGVALVIASLAAVAVVLALMYREARDQRNAALTQHERAETGRAEALRDSARSAFDKGDVLEARAKLRMSLEARDSTQARALWWRLAADPLLWKTKQMQALDLDWSADGETLATVLGGPVAQIDTRTGELVGSKQGDRVLFACDQSPDGRRLVGAGSDVVVWDLRSDAEIMSFESGNAMIRSVRVSADGRRIVAAGAKDGIYVWSLESGELERTLGSDVDRLDLADDGETLVAVGADRVPRVWNLSTGALLRELEGAPQQVFDVAIAPDARLIALASTDGKIRIWEREGAAPVRIIDAHQSPVRRLAFHPDGKRLASGSADGEVALWDAAGGERLETLCQDLVNIKAVAFDRAGERLAAATQKGEIRAWSMALGRGMPRPRGHYGIWLDGAFSPDGELLATAEWNNPNILLWDVETGALRRQLAGHESGVRVLAFHPTGDLLASAGSDGAVRVWNHGTGELLSVLLGHGELASAVAFGPDGTLASGDAEGMMRIWDEAGGSLRAQVRAHEQSIAQIDFSPDGCEIATASNDGTIRLWSPVDGTFRGVAHEGPELSVHGVRYSPDGRFLAHAGGGGALALWDRDRQVSVEFQRLDTPYLTQYRMLDFHPDGSLVGAAPGDVVPRMIWNRETGELKAEIFNFIGPGLVFRFSPDGAYVAADDASAVRLWFPDGRPHWRAPLLLPDPPRLFTHRGWVALETGEAVEMPADADWARAVEQRARYGSASADGQLLCLITHDEQLEMWHRGRDELLTRRPLGTQAEARAFSRGCLTGFKLEQQSLRVEMHLVDGKRETLMPEAMAYAAIGDRLLVADKVKAVEYDVTGAEVGSFEVHGIVAGITPFEDGLVIGYFDGNIEVVTPSGENKAPRRLRDTPEIAVEQIRVGPADTLIASSSVGIVGVWHAVTGELLHTVKLNGRPTFVHIEGGKLYLATDIGDHEVLDMSVFERDYCELLQEVWRVVPVIWDEGRPVVREPPAGHECSRATATAG
jgi:WD40 repeat protein/serine/threonine protein kinase